MIRYIIQSYFLFGGGGGGGIFFGVSVFFTSQNLSIIFFSEIIEINQTYIPKNSTMFIIFIPEIKKTSKKFYYIPKKSTKKQ